LLIELFHVCDGKTFECFAISTTVGQEVEKGQDRGQTVSTDGIEEMICEGGAAVWGGYGCYAEDVEFALSKMGCEVSTVEATLGG